MTLTVQQIYDRYSVRDYCQKVEIKRKNKDGSYEATWQDIEEISGLDLLDNSVLSMDYEIANNSFSFGIINVGNLSLILNSKNGQFDDENNSSSIFFGYIRHGSLVRVKQGYVDKYTDSNNPVDVFEKVFEGFIDDTSDSTKVDDENLKQTLYCVDVLYFLLKSNTVSDVGPLVSTTTNDLVFEVMNRVEFTQFFTVDNINIDAGFDIQNFDASLYEGQTQLLSLFENISIGNSFFYVRDGVFYFKPIFDGNTSTLTIDDRKLAKFSGYNSGISKVFEIFSWEGDDSISYEAPSAKYKRSQKVVIDGMTDFAEKVDIVQHIGSIARVQRREFTIEIPFFPKIFILDKITIEAPEIIPSDAFIWGVSNWGEDKWRRALRADDIPTSDEWLVRKISHSSLKTKILVQEII